MILFRIRKESGYPKFKKKGIHDSYTTNAQLNKSNGLYSIRVIDNKKDNDKKLKNKILN